MKNPELYIGNKRLILSQRIGKGGEGEVFLVENVPGRAVKVYTGRHDDGRETKVKEMVRLGLASSSNLISFPEEVVTIKSGRFVGFTMRLVQGHRPIHELYGVKSRKNHFPKADYRFLVRAAANAARAVGQVHASPCVIGDINHSGILVSGDATVALIDADSFQLQIGGRTLPCIVGVPDFTPPELQGKSLRGLVRTQVHDHFGLAVAIFQLLLMGKHPYAGRQTGGDFTLDQLIARDLFAYSRSRKLGVAPPPGAATLADFPDEVANAFERAFGTDPALRPSAVDWVGLLQGLEKHLSRCSSNSMHFFPSAAKRCPWCEMEASSGAILFLSVFTGSGVQVPSSGSFDVERIWLAIKGTAIPATHSVLPKLPSLPSDPSQEARNEKGAKREHNIVCIVIAVAILGLWIAFPAATILWILALIGTWFYSNQNSTTATDWQRRYSEVDDRWEKALEQWRSNLKIGPLQELRADLEKAVNEFRSLGSAKSQAINRLGTERRSRQLHDYLDTFLIRDASIAGIGPARKVTLASFGIESAADITVAAITGISGFGPAMAAKLTDWRSSYERRFVYNSAPLPADTQARSRVEAEYAAKSTALIKRISGGQVELAQIAGTLQKLSSVENANLSRIAVARAQLKVDLEFLGIPLPPQHRSWSTMPPQSSFSSGSATVGGVTCPSCGSTMVQRMARRGRRRGRMFWGCSQYPRCRGTRN